MKILFISRTYHPLVGGIEKFASDFYDNMSTLADVDLIANRYGKRRIFQFFIKVLWYLVFNSRKYDIIHLNDAVLSPVVPIIRFLSNAKVTFTVHGLDIVYKKYQYQNLIIPFLKKADRVFCVSGYTKQQCLSRNIPEEVLHVIPNGLDFSVKKHCDGEHKDRLLRKFQFETKDKEILLSLGRLSKRKGHAWFIENIFTKLPENYIYLIAGATREFDNISNLVKKLDLDKRVIMLGFVTEEEKACLYEISDLFLMPNIYIENDQEGFGIVLLEAGSYGLPSIASNIEGITDAVINGVTGTLVDERDVQGYIDAITQADFNRDEIPVALIRKYDWTIISQKYYNHFKSVVGNDHNGSNTD